MASRLQRDSSSAGHTSITLRLRRPSAYVLAIANRVTLEREPFVALLSLDSRGPRQLQKARKRT